MVLTAPEYLAGAAAAAAIEFAGEATSLVVFEDAQVTFSEHGLRHLGTDILKSQAKAAVQQAIRTGQFRYVGGGTFIGRIIIQGQQYYFTGIFQNGVAVVNRITQEMQDSLARLLQ